MNFVWFEDFKVLATSGNFSRAADERNVTQPAFSRRIRALETWLGVDLFDRTSQPAKLTVAGEWFGEVAEKLLERVASLPEEAKAVAQMHSATLRLAATHALSFTFLPRWLRTLEAHATLGPVQLMSDVLPKCEALLHQGKVQFVLSHAHPTTHGSLQSDAYTSMVVGNDQLLPVCAPDASGKPLHWLETGANQVVPILQYSVESGIGQIKRAVLGPKLAALKVQVVFTAHLASVLRTMALDGRGIAWLPRTLIEEDLEAHRLVKATQDDSFDVQLQICLYRARQPAGAAGEALWAAAVKAGATPLGSPGAGR